MSFADPDIYFRTPVQVRLMDIIFKRVSLTVEFVMELLRETVFQVLALDNWTDNVKLTNIGASSFDIVHLTSQFELYLRIYIERVKSKQVLSSDVRDVLDSLCRDLLDNLLSKTLCEVAVCLFSKLGIVLMKQESCARQYEGSPEKNAFKVVEQGFIMEDVISTSNKGQKRLCDDTGSTVSKQPKLLKDLHNAITHGGCQFIVNSALLEYASKVKTVDTLSLRGGRTYENGRYILKGIWFIMNIYYLVHAWCTSGIVIVLSVCLFVSHFTFLASYSDPEHSGSFISTQITTNHDNK